MGFQVEKDWTTRAGFRAVVIMGGMGSRCGYVGVPKGHPLYGASYSEPHPALSAPPDDEPVGKRGIMSLICSTPETMNSPDMVFDVHGSLTYAGNGDGKYPVESDLWWLGYDCGHAGDGKSPEYMDMQRERYPNSPIMWHDDGVFRSLDYCVSECESLARQIVERVVAPVTGTAPMNNITTIQTTIYRILAEQLGIPESQITPESTLDSLDADSLDRVEIVMVIEDDLEMEIDDAEFEGVQTVRQVIELVGRLRG